MAKVVSRSGRITVIIVVPLVLVGLLILALRAGASQEQEGAIVGDGNTPSALLVDPRMIEDTNYPERYLMLSPEASALETRYGSLRSAIASSPDVKTALQGTRLNGTAGDGGGVYTANGNLTVKGCTVEENTANGGGGVLIVGGTVHIGGTTTINECPIEFNEAMWGGGTLVDGGIAGFEGCSLVHNTAEDGGGGMCITNCAPSVTSCTFAQNEATQGGALFTSNSGATFSSCRFGPISGSPPVGADLAGTGAETYTVTDTNILPYFDSCGFRGGWLAQYMYWYGYQLAGTNNYLLN